MPLPERVLFDTSAFYALVSESDSLHQRATVAYERIIDRNQELWTTSYILVECIALVHRRLGFSVLSQFLDFVELSIRVYWIENTIHSEAIRRLIASNGSGLSFVDWTLALASNATGAHVFTFDRGFVAQGIPVIPG